MWKLNSALAQLMSWRSPFNDKCVSMHRFSWRTASKMNPVFTPCNYNKDLFGAYAVEWLMTAWDVCSPAAGLGSTKITVQGQYFTMTTKLYLRLFVAVDRCIVCIGNERDMLYVITL